MEELETQKAEEEAAVPAEETAEVSAENTENKESRENAAPKKKNYKRQAYKKVCQFCQEKTKIDYKDAQRLRKFIAEGGKILPRRMTGTCARHQRELATAIKRARVAALLPFKAD